MTKSTATNFMQYKEIKSSWYYGTAGINPNVVLERDGLYR